MLSLNSGLYPCGPGARAPTSGHVHQAQPQPQGGKTYHSVLLVEGVREPVIRPRGRPPKDAPAKTRVVHHTLANLSRLPEPLVALIEQFCRGKLPTGEAPRVQMGPCYGLLAGLTVTDALARLHGVRLIGLGEPTLALWRRPDS